MTTQRMKWDAEAAFKSLNAQGKRRQASIDDERLKTTPYTPPPNVAAWLRAQADKPKGRDYDAILRAAKKAPVGYYEDAPTGIKFGGQPLPSAGSKPHGKDVDTADGPWPKRIMGTDALGILEGPHNGTAYYRSGTVTRISCEAVADSWLIALQGSYRLATESEAAQWLEQNGHKDAAAQLRVTPRADVATGGGRVWRGACCDWAVIGERCYIGPSRRDMKGGWEDSKCDPNKMPDHWPELFGPERDAILSKCRKAMGL